MAYKMINLLGMGILLEDSDKFKILKRGIYENK